MPFSISPDANMLWLGEKHSEALASLKYGIHENKGFLVLTGNIGTGKTALINRLMREIDVPALVATIPDPGLSNIDFFNLLAYEFKLNGKFNTKGDFLILFKKFLHETYSSDKKVLLIIDEAQRVNNDLLEQIRLLSNIEMDNRKLINIFFVGQSEFNKILMTEENKATRQRIAVRYHLEPLTREETAQYIEYRFKMAGATGEIFQPKAIRDVFYLSRGYPRVINILCDRCLLTGYSMEVQSINASIIKECAKELQIPVIRKQVQTKEQVFSQKKANKEPKKNSKSGSFKLKVAAIVLIVLAWGMAGYSFYRAKIGKPILSVFMLKPIEKSDYAAKQQKDFSTRKSFENGTLITDQNNNIQNQRNELIYFNYDSNDLDSESLKDLDKLSKFILQHPDSKVIIKGYTDTNGNYWYNKNLSKNRAEIVKSHLVDRGISPLKIEAVGMGSENPIASNETSDGRKKNRRVEIKIHSK